MGYFNYFIKCIIRNIAYKLCKPKVFLTVLLSIIILFGLKHYGFCALTDEDYVMIADGFASVTQNQGVIISQLGSIGVDVSEIEAELKSIQTEIDNIGAYTSNINNNVITILNRLNTLNTNVLNIYNKLDENQKELIETLETNNQEVLEELQTLRALLTGDSTESTGVKLNSFTYYDSNPLWSDYNSVTTTITSGNLFGATTFNYTFKAGYTYTFTYIPTTTTAGNSFVGYTFDDVSTGSSVLVYNLGRVNRLSNSFSIKFNNNTNLTLLFRSPVDFSNAYGSWKIEGEINGSINNLNNSINQGNQLQQEQNDFLKQESSDSDVSIDGFNSVDANDITSDGLTGVFTNIYNSITSWSSKDINLPIPYTNKSIVIPANYTENMLSSFGGGWIITFISSIYYFIVARFIIYSITSIINSIKSGSILETDSKNNITTDML